MPIVVGGATGSAVWKCDRSLGSARVPYTPCGRGRGIASLVAASSGARAVRGSGESVRVALDSLALQAC